MRRVFVILTLMTLGFVALFGPVERMVVYPFSATRTAPEDARLREVSFETGDARLILWVADPAPGKPTVLYFHGNAGNLSDRAGRFRRFLDRGYGLIAPAYRGSSGSSGKPSEQAIATDMAAVYAARSQLIPGLTADHLVLYGESLGTGVAIAVAVSSRLDHPAALLLEAPYTSLPDVAANAYPPLAPLTRRMANQWNSLGRAGALNLPLLIIHGAKDTLIPIEQGRQIYSAAPSLKKRFLAIADAGHADLWRSDTLPDFWRFIDRYADK
ncbi:alpha/beta hydrolase [Thalassovita taeanensis]|uniref:Serine aminopeptidase S33 domain-containing protein n=1 Tax=Thalassovita taeanensis TaxID=657014 RepID=A0A1H9EG44_9RHOB|nr:alpha/beta hydrolase [Thalassovita taeanensis]SEQ24527.1 hypothetical protein SAMN04488092_10534 [Thalassovita taeanensis]